MKKLTLAPGMVRLAVATGSRVGQSSPKVRLP
jgi:hypothetical protein